MKYKIGFTCGAFDLLHAGHILMLKECKDYCDYLIVGLQTDPSIDRPTKHKPIQDMFERKVQLQAVRYVDEIRTYTTEDNLIELLRDVKPDVRIIGADWKGKEYTGYELGIPAIFNSRNHSYSTSELRKRVYDAECV